jgi:uncharacterized protein YcbK (DUF882 family)
MNRRRFLLNAVGLLSAPYAAFAAPVVSPRFRLRLLDARTGAAFDAAYRDAEGPISRVMDQLSLFLRDHYSGGATKIDVGVIDFLADVMITTAQTSAVVLSAFRSLETNVILARTTFGVAENSQHLYGRALDVRFGARLFDAVVAARAMKRGGVGWYPRSGFIHLDTGPVRNWDLDTGGLQELLTARPPTGVGQTPKKREMLSTGPDHLIVGGGKPAVVLPGRAGPQRRVVGLFQPPANTLPSAR